MANSEGGRAPRFLTSMAPHQMAIAGLLGIAAILAIVGLWRWATEPSYQTLVVGQEPQFVSDSIGELEAAGIDYRVGAGGTMIEVPKSQIADAEVRLASAGLSTSTTPGYELLDSQGFSTSSFQQRINYQRALEGELTRTIVEMDQVLAASVHLSIPEDELFTDEEDAPTASVVIDTAGSIGSSAVTGIVNVVASAVPGMSPDGVTVADTSGRVLSEDGVDASTDALMARRALEQQLEASAQTMLNATFGQANALVRVSADVDLDEAEKETVTYDPESQVAIREQTIVEQYAGNSDTTSGIVGVTDDILTGQPAAGGDSATDYTRNERTSEFGVDRIRTLTRNSSGDVLRLSVAVVVNEGLEPSPNLGQVSEVVAAAVGLDSERGDVIAVEAIPFDEQFVQDAESAVLEVPSEPSDPLAPIAPFLGIAQTALAVLALLAVILSLRKGVRTFTATLRPVEEEPKALEAAAATESDEDEKSKDEPSETAADLLALERGPVSPDDVMRIIDQQPIEVASLLRSWADKAVVNQ